MAASKNELEELYRRFAPLVHARARRIVGDDAEDVVQEVFIRYMRRPPEHERVDRWFYRVSTNLCIDLLRRRNHRNRAWQTQQGTNDHRVDVDALLADRELTRRLLVRMDERTQCILALVVFDDMSQAEAADMMGISRKTVAKRLRRLEKQAHKILARWSKS